MQENATKINSADLVNQCVDNLIIEKGLEKLDVNKRMAVHDALAEQLTGRMNEAIIYRLPDESFEEAKRYMEGGNVDVDKLRRIVEGAGLDIDKIIAGVIERFRKDFLAIDMTSLGENGKEEA